MKKSSSKSARGLTRKMWLTIIIISIVVVLVLAAVVAAIFIRRSRRDDNMITLTYANWNLDSALELRMIQSFMDMNPHIRIEIDRNISQPWTNSLSVAAAQNRMPDVFILEDIGTKANAGWLMDMTPHVWNDLDFFDLSSNIQEAMRVGGSMNIYALPFEQHIHGYFVNRDLFRALGVEPPAFGVSPGDFIGAVQAVTDTSRPSVGLDSVFSFVEWYPGAVNPMLGFFGYDGLGFALNSPEMLEAIHVAAELHNGGFVFDGLAYTGAFAADDAFISFIEGQVALFYGGTWLAEVVLNQAEFDWEFIGVPGGRSVVTLEVLGISSTTSHPEEAYAFARWMGHGTEGSLRRLEYAQDMGLAPQVWPTAQSSDVLGELLAILPVPGLAELYHHLDRALISGLRVMPGYMQARFTAPTGVNVPGSQLANIGVDQLIRYSILGYTHYPEHSATAEAVARYQLNAALGR